MDFLPFEPLCKKFLLLAIRIIVSCRQQNLAAKKIREKKISTRSKFHKSARIKKRSKLSGRGKKKERPRLPFSWRYLSLSSVIPLSYRSSNLKPQFLAASCKLPNSPPYPPPLPQCACKTFLFNPLLKFPLSNFICRHLDHISSLGDLTHFLENHVSETTTAILGYLCLGVMRRGFAVMAAAAAAANM